MAKPHKYKGILGRPRSMKLPLGYLLHPDDEDWQQKAIADAKKQDDELVDALFTYFKVRRDDPFGWEKVARKLAGHHIPAFRPITSKSRGRPPGPTDWALAEEVMDLRKRRGLSIRAACAVVAKKRRDESTARQLEHRFHNVMKSGKAAKAAFERMRRK